MGPKQALDPFKMNNIIGFLVGSMIEACYFGNMSLHFLYDAIQVL